MLYQPEFADIEKLKQLMSMLEDSKMWRQIGNSDESVAIRIGTDNHALMNVDNVSVIASKFRINNEEEGQLMVMGPTRMPYNQLVALMEYMTDKIEKMFNDE